METIIAVVSAFCIIVFAIVAVVAAAFFAAFIVLSFWALIKPHIGKLIDTWLDWFDRRIE